MITAANFRTRYPQLTGTTEDSTILELAADADDLIAAFCGMPEPIAGAGHTMQLATYTVYVDRPSAMEPSALCLCVRPIISITSINVDATRVYGAGTLLVAGTDYTFDAVQGIILQTYGSLFSWPTTFRATKVVLVAGYAVTPPGLRSIACATVRHLWNLRAVQGESAFGIAGDSATLTDTDVLLPQAVKDALQSGGYLTPCAAARMAA